MPVAVIFENLEAGSDIAGIVEQFHVAPEQIQAVLEFAASSLDVQALASDSVIPSPTSRNRSFAFCQILRCHPIVTAIPVRGGEDRGTLPTLTAPTQPRLAHIHPGP